MRQDNLSHRSLYLSSSMNFGHVIRCGSRYMVSKKGWIDQDLFNFWLRKHFVSNAVAGHPLLLLLDGHSSHYQSTTLRFAKENDIIVFCLPSHSTHECQVEPLDCSLFCPLKLHWQQAVHEPWMRYFEAKLFP